ncbi:glycosyltransferase [Methanococcoides sp. SA1]|nr:glycosyltransferase [Methanococcoides sp. SA1]
MKIGINMKILQVSNFFKPSWETGGVTKVNYELSRNLVLRGHDVTVYTTDGYSSRLDVQKNKPVDVDGIRVYYFSNLFRSFVKKVKLTNPYYLPFVLRKEIKNFDIIHIHEHRTLPAALIRHYAKKHNIPYVVQSHGSVLPFFQKSKLKKLFDHIFGYKILNDASKLIALTETEANQYVEMGLDESKICIIPNGINIEEFNDLPSKGEFKNKYSIKDDEKIILYLGRIDKIKGIDLLINAYSDLINEVDDARLIIVGPNSDYLPILEEQIMNLGIDDKVLFTGPLYGRDKLEAYVDADVYVLPSRYETFPNTVLEAAACGTAVIITDRCGIMDVVDGKLGYVVEFDKKQLSESIVNSLVNENSLIKIGSSNRKQILFDFSWHKIVEDLEDMYYNICGTNFETKRRYL